MIFEELKEHIENAYKPNGNIEGFYKVSENGEKRYFDLKKDERGNNKLQQVVSDPQKAEKYSRLMSDFSARKQKMATMTSQAQHTSESMKDLNR